MGRRHLARIHGGRDDDEVVMTNGATSAARWQLGFT
jgi:hypothetical protein